MDQPFVPPQTRGLYQIQDARAVFCSEWKGQAVRLTRSEEEIHHAWFQIQTGNDIQRTTPTAFNYAVRRDPACLLSGDLPRWALVESPRTKTVAPPLLKQGDLRIRIVAQDRAWWLDEHGTVRTQYHPWGTIHQVDLAPELPLKVEVLATLAQETGVAIRVAIERGSLAGSPEVLVELHYGGLGVARTVGIFPEYLWPSADQADGNAITPQHGQAVISDAAVPEPVHVAVHPPVKAEIAAAAQEDAHRRVVFAYHVGKADPSLVVRLVAGAASVAGQPLRADDFDTLVEATQAYYRNMLADVEISTPDPVLDCGFYSSVVNMDYVYLRPGWLEGLQGWATYYSNNYQASAAVALGQMDRAREALLFYGDRPEGPGQILAADGSVEPVPYCLGLPYFILQLHRYWRATGDNPHLARLWEGVCRNLGQYLAARDSDGDGLLDSRLGSNVLLYQSDHLSLPGAATSPSLMMVGVLRRMAEMADALGQSAQAQQWRRQAVDIRDNVLRRLWLPDEGRFASYIDAQGAVGRAAYFTDFAYPILYADIEDEHGWRSLEAMDRMLSIGDCLLRTGNYQPDLFGNNGVHQVGMCEASEAYFRAGRAQRGWALLHGTARSAVTLTDSPGAIAEFCSWRGYGILNTLFGNPIGSFVQAVVGGLFGLERVMAARSMRWRPAVPEQWASARLRLGEIVMEIEGQASCRTYRLGLPIAQGLELCVPSFGLAVDQVTDGSGGKLPFELVARPGGDMVIVRLPAAAKHTVKVILGSATAETRAPRPVAKAPAPRPQSKPRQAVPVDLGGSFNAQRLRLVNMWYWNTHFTYDLRSSLETSIDPDRGIVVVGGSRFTVKSHGQNIVALSAGDLDADNRPQPSDLPAATVFPVGSSVAGMEFLTVAEPRVRLTGMVVGSVVCRYDDGGEQSTPLIVGGNIDSAILPFASDVRTRRMDLGYDVHQHLSAWTVEADEARRMREVEVRIELTDVVLGILAVNLLHSHVAPALGQNVAPYDSAGTMT